MKQVIKCSWEITSLYLEEGHIRISEERGHGEESDLTGPPFPSGYWHHIILFLSGPTNHDSIYFINPGIKIHRIMVFNSLLPHKDPCIIITVHKFVTFWKLFTSLLFRGVGRWGAPLAMSPGWTKERYFNSAAPIIFKSIQMVGEPLDMVCARGAKTIRLKIIFHPMFSLW